MNIEQLTTYCTSKPLTTAETPFGPDVLVYKVAGKMFALAGIDNFDRVSLKVEPEKGVELRERYETIVPAYHMNKKHWVTAKMGGGVNDKFLCQLIDESYNLVVSGLPKKTQALVLKKK